MIQARLRSLTCLLTLALSGSCASSPRQEMRAPPARADIATDRSWDGGNGGYIYRVAYFTADQISDQRWEEMRLELRTTVRMCRSGERLIRRDVRWYPATPASGQRCAAVVYTFQCDMQTNATERSLRIDRLRYLRQDPEPELAADCGEKDDTRRPPPPPPVSIYDLAPMQSAAARCIGSNAYPASPLRVDPHSRLQSTTLISPDLNAPPGALYGPMRNTPTSAVQGSFGRAQRVGPILRATPVVDDGSNILVEQHIARDRSGQGYCVSLTARQAGRTWRREIHRPRFVEELRREVGLSRQGLSNDPARFWTPTADARVLATALADHLLAHAVPEAEFRRRPFSQP